MLVAENLREDSSPSPTRSVSPVMPAARESPQSFLSSPTAAFVNQELTPSTPPRSAHFLTQTPLTPARHEMPSPAREVLTPVRAALDPDVRTRQRRNVKSTNSPVEHSSRSKVKDRTPAKRKRDESCSSCGKSFLNKSQRVQHEKWYCKESRSQVC